VVERSGLTRGDRRRNDRIEALRAVVTADRAILAVDLGEDKPAPRGAAVFERR
jgi:transposase